MFNLPKVTSSGSASNNTPSLFDSAIVAEPSRAKGDLESQSSDENKSRIEFEEAEKNNASKAIAQPSKHIVEVKVFYSDGTFETLKP